jgi:DNA-binding IscR family transcriptional regulator
MGGEDILGNSALHEQLCLSSCILAELLRRAPAAIDIEQLVLAVGHPREEVEQMCSQLYRNGLLQPDAERQGIWMLAGDPARITLADLFSALLAGPNGRRND